jgi:hypothetical protein
LGKGSRSPAKLNPEFPAEFQWALLNPSGQAKFPRLRVEELRYGVEEEKCATGKGRF